VAQPAASTNASPVLAEISARFCADLPAATPPPQDEPWHGQSLAKGAAGIALHRIELAQTHRAEWRHAHGWIIAATSNGASAADSTGLLLGAPAIAFMLHAASGKDRYANASADVGHAVATLAERRVVTATERIATGTPAEFIEYDLFHGLTGIGAVLLQTDPGCGAMEQILNYLVSLTRPLRHDERTLPGWWVSHDPERLTPAAYTGHGNFGAAHGITGPLALLSQAARRGLIVKGHREAIETIFTFLDSWRQDSPAGSWWPEWITVGELDTGRCKQVGPERPSWCYGTPGIARAGQLAAIATGDISRQAVYENALLACLDDATQRTRIIDAGICHGAAGLFQTVWRAANDATDQRLRDRLPGLADDLVRLAQDESTVGPGFLLGRAGCALAVQTAATDAAPISGWDACLLIE
jgi:lantibiotic biosynthesis protein